ncbi:AAA family ATPase [Bacillus thuringiensis]|uniref:retron Eco8 family effector endonuclease n=1 Tax=Bacillus thuringiensis TaxID=1428 RepID=UPI00187575AE|nr:retron Eco8 family effector endonuclease [Bacillus thuringiensis]MBE5090622.1 AAA family ATPase [Bacillus thuringiensis]
MSITRIQIKNFKVIDYLDISIKEINCLIGINNVGKSSIMKAFDHFYKNLTGEFHNEDIFNKKNPYSQEVEIVVYYDLEEFFKKLKDDYDSTFEEEINKVIRKYTSLDNQLIVKFRRGKKGKAIWNIDYKCRQLVKRYFPLFFLESRKINLYNWDSIWGVLGSINPYNTKIEALSSLSSLEKNVMGKVMDVFGKYGVSIRSASVYEKISTMVQMQLGGRKFNHHEYSLEMGSFGINSYAYINIYIGLITNLYEKKGLANPFIIIDEPEIHLHNKNIERLVSGILEGVDKKIRFMFATHSPAFVKNVIIKNQDSQILHVSRNEKEKIIIKKMKDLRENRKIRFMSDREANLFFSTGCIFVEGETELELFTNENIANLFPQLIEYDVYNFDSKIDKLKLVNPADKKIPIKYFLIIDMDKVLVYKNNKFELFKKEKYLNLLVNSEIKRKELNYYTKKFYNTVQVRKKIEDIIDNCNFPLNEKGILIEEKLYKELKQHIQDYFLEYNIYPVSSTIEGAIINEKSIYIVYDWLLTEVKNVSLLKRIFESLSEEEKVVFIRMLFDGKPDSLANIKKFDENLYKDIKMPIKFDGKLGNLRSILMNRQQTKSMFGKTSGWVTNFYTWYFKNYIDFNKSSAENIKSFAFHFKEIYTVISKL